MPDIDFRLKAISLKYGRNPLSLQPRQSAQPWPQNSIGLRDSRRPGFHT
ncbi:hypothetical protein ACFOEY_07165 [Paracandidimonas soli]